MPKFCYMMGCLVIAAAAASVAAQPPRGGPGPRGRGDIIASSVSRMMAFDENDDGTLSKSEVTDARLQSLFDRADADRDEVVTKQELTNLFAREAESPQAAGPGDRPRGRRGEARADGPPRAGPVHRPRPGQVLPPFVVEELRLTNGQRAQLDKLQQEVDARLAKILTDEQRQRLAELPPHGPGGPPPGAPPPPRD